MTVMHPSHAERAALGFSCSFCAAPVRLWCRVPGGWGTLRNLPTAALHPQRHHLAVRAASTPRRAAA